MTTLCKFVHHNFCCFVSIFLLVRSRALSADLFVVLVAPGDVVAHRHEDDMAHEVVGNVPVWSNCIVSVPWEKSSPRTRSSTDVVEFSHRLFCPFRDCSGKFVHRPQAVSSDDARQNEACPNDTGANFSQFSHRCHLVGFELMVVDTRRGDLLQLLDVFACQFAVSSDALLHMLFRVVGPRDDIWRSRTLATSQWLLRKSVIRTSACACRRDSCSMYSRVHYNPSTPDQAKCRFLKINVFG